MRAYRAAVLAVLLTAALPRESRAQQPDTSLSRHATPQVVRPNAPRADDTPSRSEVAVVRRQPKALLAGIALNRPEKKAVYGIIRRNDRALAALAERESHARESAAARAQLERDLAAVRDRERAELRAVLNDGQRKRFDQNLASLNAHSR